MIIFSKEVEKHIQHLNEIPTTIRSQEKLRNSESVGSLTFPSTFVMKLSSLDDNKSTTHILKASKTPNHWATVQPCDRPFPCKTSISALFRLLTVKQTHWKTYYERGALENFELDKGQLECFKTFIYKSCSAHYRFIQTRHEIFSRYRYFGVSNRLNHVPNTCRLKSQSHWILVQIIKRCRRELSRP